MTYRNDFAALSARKTALETEVRDRQRELDEARRMVDELEARARLPVLDNIRVAAPCSARWDNMVGDDRVRSCGDCQKNVYNLSELTRDQAEALIRETEGRLCVRYFRRADGTILLKDCAVGVKRRRHGRIAAAGVAASLAAAAFGYTRHREADSDMLSMERGASFMGEISRSGPPLPEPPTLPARPPQGQELEVMGAMSAPPVEPPPHKSAAHHRPAPHTPAPHTSTPRGDR